MPARLYEIRREDLPAGTRAVAWRDGDRIVVVVQRGLGRLEARAAVARALRGLRGTRERDLALLPVLAPRRHLLAAAAGSGVIAASVTLVLLLPSGPPPATYPSPSPASASVASPHPRHRRPRPAVTPLRAAPRHGGSREGRERDGAFGPGANREGNEGKMDGRLRHG